MIFPATIEKLVIAVPVYFVENRLCYLSRISSYFDSLADSVEVFIFTNTDDALCQKKIRDAIGLCNFKYSLHVPKLLGHPYFLTWAHLELFRQCFSEDKTITHFMYLEDDILVKKENVEYWLKGREELRHYGLIPSFLRYELKANRGEPYCSDLLRHVNPYVLARAEVSNNYVYFNLPKPYQGMYLLDRELMQEHLTGRSSNPDFGVWNIREKAAQGITFLNVPEGCLSRNFVGFDTKNRQIDSGSLIHHTPNNYADDSTRKYGKILVRDLFRPKFNQSFDKPKLIPVSKTFSWMQRHTSKKLHPLIARLFS